MRRLWIGIVAAMTVGSVAHGDFRLPLDLRPNGGEGGMRVVSNGVPLLPGQAMDTNHLHVIGPDGKEVPAQFRVLARWWRQDNAIRWVLVDFVRTGEEGSNPTYQLVERPDAHPRPKTQLTVTEDPTVIRVNTGVALFEISKNRFNLLNRVTLDADGDGTFAESETVVHPDPKLGSVVKDPDGRTYYSSIGTQSVQILERGPVTVKVLAQGTHVSTDDGAFKPGLYGYEVFLTFHAGQPSVDIDAILTNNSLKPIGEPHFEDWSLVTRIGRGRNAWRCKMLSGTADDLSGTAGESAVLYQDSVGTEHWKKNTGIQVHGWPRPPDPDLSTFRGYRLWRVASSGREALGHGDFANGMAACETGGMGCTVSPRYFWQQFPSALEFGGDGVVRLAPFPREYKSVHWLEDATAKAQESRLYFYMKRDGPATSAQRAARRYQTRVFALPSPEHCGRAGALSDLGPYMMHPKMAEAATKDVAFSLKKTEGLLFTTTHGYGNGYGWQAFGMRWFEMAGHSPWNYEPIAASGSLWTHLLNANPDRLEWGMRVARHARDVRAYHVEGRDNLALWTDWRTYNETAVIEHYSRLVRGPVERNTVRRPDTGPHPYTRQRWPLPNMSHLNLDEVYDLYLFTGDDRAFRCMRTIADHGMTWILLRPGKRRVHRDEGWCMRTLMRYYELTEDTRYEPFVRKVIDRIWQDVDKAGTWVPNAGPFYHAVYARGAMTAWLATGDERMRDLVLGVADWDMTYEVTPAGYPFPSKKAPPWTMTPEERVGPKGQRGMCPPYGHRHHIDLFAFAYHQTGERKYLDAMAFAWAKNAGTWFQGYFPTAMRMAYGPRPDRVAPASVSDLTARADGARATLTWTAPGDDGTAGTARVYQIKHAAKPILEFVPWPEKRHTHVAFWGATNVTDEPSPEPAGTRQSYTVTGLAPGTHHFALKTRDECGNQSPISNGVAIVVGR